MGMEFVKTFEVLPGKHVLLVGYDDGSFHSTQSQEIDIDAKGGENYELSANAKIAWKDENSKWNAAISSFTPSEHDADFSESFLLEGSETMDGVVQSVEADKHGYVKSFLLSVPGESSPRMFKQYYSSQKLQVGQKIEVEYYPSSPEIADSIGDLK
jgi:hypothetical protein